MDHKENALIRRTRRVVLATVALLALGLLGSFVWWRLRLNYEVNGRLRALRATGLPTSGAELDQWYARVPDSENAALALTQAFELMCTFPDRRSNEVSNFKLPIRGERLTPDQVRLLSDYVSLNEAALAKARDAIQLPKSWFPVDFSPALNTSLPHLPEVKALARIACDEALLAIESGRPSDATPPIVTIVGLARTLNEEPVLISQLVRIAVFRIATSTLETRLNAGALNETDFTALTPVFVAAEKSSLMARALVGETAMAIPYFRMSLAEANHLSKADEEATQAPSGPPLPGRPPMWALVTGFFERDLRFFLGVMETNVALARLGPPESLASTNLNEQVVLTAKSKYYILSELLLPSLSRVLVKEAENLAFTRISTSALAVEHFRLIHHRLPTELGEVVPEFLPALPVDPFDGAPLRYRQLAKGYVVYSVGQDGHDDGGKELPAKRRSTEHPPQDLTFTVER